MSFEDSLAAPTAMSGQFTVMCPHAGDNLGGAFRTAFCAVDQLPDDFLTLLAALDRQDTRPR